MIINTQEIEEYIKEKSLDVNTPIEISDDELKAMKEDTEYIYQCDLNTIIKLQNAVNRYKKEIEMGKETEKERLIKERKVQCFGLDIGKVRIITASNEEMDNYTILKEKHLTERIKKYERSMKNINKARDHKGKKELFESFKKHVRNIIKNELIYKLELECKQPTVFIIGKNYLTKDKYNTQQILTDEVYSLLKEVSKDSEKILDVHFVSERYSSVKCPKCKSGKPEHKTKKGFKCSECGFFHKRPDVVACRNIIDNYIRSKKLEISKT
ncbi:zinc ribbon domain-containing protein [Staphylococcus saprophyticus]|uniref:zinc ribbon domain-containing protein n=1 Tax=Staphylococcus saprophyticus TaxID=29385 RepID=UPI001305065A|nr:zinc ribbon domain-containing protein [Staphylococcus saprophyticus]